MKRFVLAGLAGVLLASAGVSAAPKPVVDDRSVEELVKAMGGELSYDRMMAAEALAAKGPGVTGVLIEALASKDRRVRRSATDGLAKLGEEAKAAVPALTKAMGDSDAWVRDGAAAALGAMKAEAAPAAKALAKACTDEDPWVRLNAIGALKSATQDKELLLSAAIGLLKIPATCWRSRGGALDVIAKHGKDHKPAIPALLFVLESPSEGMWDCSAKAVELLVGMGAGKQAVPILIERLKDTYRSGPRRAADKLALLGKDAKAAIPALKEIAEKAEDPRDREGAQKALEKIE